MKIVGRKVDYVISKPEVLAEEARRWHPVSSISGTVYSMTEKVNLIQLGHEAGTHDGMRDGASHYAERHEGIYRVYYDAEGLIEAGYKLPA